MADNPLQQAMGYLGTLLQFLNIGTGIQDPSGRTVTSIISSLLTGKQHGGALLQQAEEAMSGHYTGQMILPIQQDMAQQRQALAVKFAKDLFGHNRTDALAAAGTDYSLPSLLSMAFLYANGSYDAAKSFSSLVKPSSTPGGGDRRGAMFAQLAFRYVMGQGGNRWKHNLKTEQMVEALSHAYKEGTFTGAMRDGRPDMAALFQQMDSVSRIGEIALDISPSGNITEGLQMINHFMGDDFLVNPKKMQQTANSLYQLHRTTQRRGGNSLNTLQEIGQAVAGKPAEVSSRIISAATNSQLMLAAMESQTGRRAGSLGETHMARLAQQIPESDMVAVAAAGYTRLNKMYGSQRAGEIVNRLMSVKEHTESPEALLAAFNRSFGYGTRPMDMNTVRDLQFDSVATAFRHSPGALRLGLTNMAQSVPDSVISGVEEFLGGQLTRNDRHRLRRQLLQSEDYQKTLQDFFGMDEQRIGKTRRLLSHVERNLAPLGGLTGAAWVASAGTEGFKTHYRNNLRETQNPREKLDIQGGLFSGWDGATQALQDPNTKASWSGLGRAVLGTQYGDYRMDETTGKLVQVPPKPAAPPPPSASPKPAVAPKPAATPKPAAAPPTPPPPRTEQAELFPNDPSEEKQ